MLSFRFFSLKANLIGYPILVGIFFHLGCLFLKVFGVAGGESEVCKNAAIVCSDIGKYGLIEVLVFVLALAGVSYRRILSFDPLKRKVYERCVILGWAFGSTAKSLSSFSRVQLEPRIEGSGWRLKGGPEIKQSVFILELRGKKTPPFLIKNFSAFIRPLGYRAAIKMGHSISEALGIPLVDAIKNPEIKPQESKDAVLKITRDDVEKILVDWQGGRLSAEGVQKWSQEHHPDQGVRYADVDWEQWETGEAESAINVVLMALDEQGEASLSRKNIPLFLEFLRAPPEQFEIAHERLRKNLKQKS